MPTSVLEELWSGRGGCRTLCPMMNIGKASPAAGAACTVAKRALGFVCSQSILSIVIVKQSVSFQDSGSSFNWLCLLS